MNLYTNMAKQVISEEAKKAKEAKDHLKAIQKIRDSKKVPRIMKIPFVSKLIKGSSLSGLGGFGASATGLSTWTKMKKFAYLGALGVSLGAIKYYEVQVSPPANKILFSTTALVAAPTALSLVTDSEWKITSYICYLVAIGYAIKELGLYEMLVDTDKFSDEFSETKIVKKKRMARNIAEKKDYLKYFD